MSEVEVLAEHNLKQDLTGVIDKPDQIAFWGIDFFDAHLDTV